MQSLASLSRFTQNPYLQKREVHPRGGPLVEKEQRLRPPSPKTQGTHSIRINLESFNSILWEVLTLGVGGVGERVDGYSDCGVGLPCVSRVACRTRASYLPLIFIWWRSFKPPRTQGGGFLQTNPTTSKAPTLLTRPACSEQSNDEAREDNFGRFEWDFGLHLVRDRDGVRVRVRSPDRLAGLHPQLPNRCVVSKTTRRST